MLRYLVLQDIYNTVFVPHSYGIRPGGTITEQSYKFPVCAIDVGLLFSFDILSQPCEEPHGNSIFSLAISVLEYYKAKSCFSA